jgi:hypothetical protein
MATSMAEPKLHDQEEPMPILDDRLDTPSVPSLCPEADALRNTGVNMLRAYFKVAAMADAAASRNFQRMLESIRDARKLYLEMYNDPEDPLMGEFAMAEMKLLRRIEYDARRVS